MWQQATPELFTCCIPEGLSEAEISAWVDGLNLGILKEHFDWLWVRDGKILDGMTQTAMFMLSLKK